MQNGEYADVIKRRQRFAIPGFRTLADVGFDGPWVTPYQIASRSPGGPVLVALHWLDEASIDANRDVLKKCGYLPTMPFNKVLNLALERRRLTRENIYVTQAFHLVPKTRSQPIVPELIDLSFDAVTRYELAGRKVLALGCVAAGACRRHGVPHVEVCHPSRRGHGFERNAGDIAAGLEGLGF